MTQDGVEVCCLVVNGYCFVLEVAATRERQHKGLGGRQSMSIYSGMLFVCEGEGERRISMRGMLFAIDILWLDRHKRIVHIEHNVTPDTYPQRFVSALPAQYIVELNAGMAAKCKLASGQQLDW